MRDTKLIAHRGGAHDAPENTLAAFRLAWETGIDGIEGDFRLTRDGEIVCIHDATTGRIAGIRLSVASSTLARLRELDVGIWKGERWAGERIPTIREVIATVPPGKRLVIELKSGPEIVLPLQQALAGSGLEPEQAVILAFSEEVIVEARNLLPQVKRLWLTDFKREWHDGGWSPSIGQILRTLERTGADGLSSKAHRSIDAAFVQALRNAGMEFHVWTVDDLRTARRFCDLGANSITTNRPGWLKTKLRIDAARADNPDGIGQHRLPEG
jgi:glycerophosphoryl diester phosphodiesterase